MAEPFWATKFRGQPIRLELNDLSNQRLRAMKSHFGPDYGVPTEFIRLLLTGDMDAITGAIWIGQQKAGGPIDDLMALDFTLDDFEKLEEPKPAAKKGVKERPTRAGTTTDDSAETPSETETGTSSTSETSSD
jgi:hypothetical protein